MIITCINCNKKFNIDEKLIPEKGRLLQCSSCNHKWHYINQNKNDEIVENIKISKNTINILDEKDKKISSSKSSMGKKNNAQTVNKNTNKNKNISLTNIFNNLIIIIISFVALIIILDTFKNNISSYFPVLIPLLDNLYLSFLDLISFVKDLFN